MRLPAALCALALSGLAVGQPADTAFTYQGELTDAGESATGLYDLQVCLFDAPVASSPLACAPEFDDWPVEDGVFTLDLDFGATAFDGGPRYIELRVRAGSDGGAYTVLAPRQRVRPAPDALHARTAASTPWSGLTDVPAGFADGIDHDSGGTVTRITAGAGLSGGDITTTGTIAIAEGGIGLAQINPAEVQARISGNCVPGSFVQGIAADGTLLCGPATQGNVTTTLAAPWTTSGNGIGQPSDVAVGPDGVPFVAFYDAVLGHLRLARCTNSTCTATRWIRSVDTSPGAGGFQLALEIGPDGLPVIAYNLSSSSGTVIANIARCDTIDCRSFTINRLDPGSSAHGISLDLAMPSDGLPVVAYVDEANEAVTIAKCADPACATTSHVARIEQPLRGIGALSLAIGADDAPILAYAPLAYSRPAEIRVAKCGAADCSGPVSIHTIASGPWMLVDCAITVGGDGLPMLAFRVQGQPQLMLARCLASDCSSTSTQMVDGTHVQSGRGLSAATASTGHALVSYHDMDSRTLMLAACRSHACDAPDLLTLDAAAPVGESSRIAVGADGRPVLSYFDPGRRALKVLKCGTPDCQ